MMQYCFVVTQGRHNILDRIWGLSEEIKDPGYRRALDRMLRSRVVGCQDVWLQHRGPRGAKLVEPKPYAIELGNGDDCCAIIRRHGDTSVWMREVVYGCISYNLIKGPMVPHDVLLAQYVLSQWVPDRQPWP